MSTTDDCDQHEYRCDICGAPATTVVRDMIVIDSCFDPVIKYEPADIIRAGCDKHPVTSVVYT